tara:strand:+ start:511 stop:1197 length:687 start_codon:yes stop_codon:yes gene_type:complete
MAFNKKFFSTGGIVAASGGGDFRDEAILHLDFENQVNDQTGNYTTSNSGTTFSTDSKVGTYSGDFDPTSDKTLVSNFYLSDTAYAIAFWVKWHSKSTNTWQMVTVMTAAKDQSADRIYIGKRYNLQTIQFRSYVTGVEEEIFNPSLNTWYHWVLNADSNGYKLYVNNASTPTWSNSTSVSGAQVGSGTDASIGGHTGTINESFDGKIDSFRVWDRILTDAERATLYNE